MKYDIRIEKRAEKFIYKQPKKQQERLLRAIYKLPSEGDIAPIVGQEELLRLRVGDYRVLFTVENGQYIVHVIKIHNRGQIYKRY